jgi:hypothetical protein
VLPNLLSRPWIVTLPVSGECVIPLKQMPIPPGTKYSGEKVAPGPGNVDKMPTAAGLPVCGVPQK